MISLRSAVSLFASLFTLLALYQAEAAPTLRIMPVGDSITYGYPVSGGYRLRLYQMLTAAGYNVDFVGTQNGNSVAGLPDPDHEGYSGYRLDQINSFISFSLNNISDPDIILLLLGTNDYGQNYDTAHATNRLESLIVNMATNRPNTKIIVANLLVRNEPYNTQIQTTFNPFISGIVQRQQALGRQVYFDDLRSAVPLSDMPDQLHPDQNGYNKMATNWYGVITNLFTPYGSTNPPAISRAYGQYGLTNLTLVFSKPLSADSAAINNFSISGGITIKSALLNPTSMREITLTTSPFPPNTTYTLTVNNVHDQTPAHLAIAPNTTVVFRSSLPRGAVINVAEAGNYTLVYSLDIPNVPNYYNGITYNIDNHAAVSNYSRVAYYLELQPNNGPLNYLWVSMNAFTNSSSKIGVPTISSRTVYQRPVVQLNILSTAPGVTSGNFTFGSLEFWPYNYDATNAAVIQNASSTTFDWGDKIGTDANGYSGTYGSMQIHNPAASQVLFAFNNWGGNNSTADLGIGNQFGGSGNPDWTFAGNASSYSVKTLQVYALMTNQPPPRILSASLLNPDTCSLTFKTQPGNTYSLWKKLDLLTGTWTKISQTLATSSSLTLTDPTTTNSACFYQIRIP